MLVSSQSPSVFTSPFSDPQGLLRRYDILSYLKRPVVAISLSAVVAITGLCIPATSLLLLVARIFFTILGGYMLGFSIQHTLSERESYGSRRLDDMNTELEGWDLRHLRGKTSEISASSPSDQDLLVFGGRSLPGDETSGLL